MSETESPSPTYTPDRDFWVDVEVYYGKIVEKWETKYEPMLRDRFDEGLIDDRILDLYFELLETTTQPDDAVVAFETLIEEDEQLGYNLCAQHEFAYQKNTGIIRDCARRSIFHAVEDTAFRSLYQAAYDAGDKVTLTALIQLFDRGVLRDIVGLDYCYAKSPRKVAESDDGGTISVGDSVDDIIEELSQGEYLEYSRWHSFKHKSKEYVLIKRQITDSVERQPAENQEEEPAEFIVLKFVDSELHIFTDKNTVAEQARESVNETVTESAFDTPDAAVGHDEAVAAIEQLFSGTEELEDSPIRVTGIKLDSSPLPQNPSLRMKASAGIADTLAAFEQWGYDLTDSVDDIKRIYLNFEGREYKLYPEEREPVDGEFVWVFRYNASHLTDDERSEFEPLIEDLLEIEVVFENT